MMGTMGSRLCKTMIGQSSGTTATNFLDLRDLGDFEKRMQYLSGYYYYDLLPETTADDKSLRHGSNLTMGDGPSEIFLKLKNRFIDEIAAKSHLGAYDQQAITADFLLCIVGLLLDYTRQTYDHTSPVLEFHHPREMRNRIGHMLTIENEPKNLEEIISNCKVALKYCVKTGHPRFFNQISQGLDIVGLAGQWVTAAANADTFSYEVAPVFTLMEEVVLSKMREYVGWKSGEGDGILTPGGTMSNLYGVAVARQRAMPHLKTQGMSGQQRLVMFTSDQSHFSIVRAGVLLGIGSDNVVIVKSDQRGRLIVSDLVEKIEQATNEGAIPFLVSVTAGTTVLGAFDPIGEAADVCEAHGLWLHVDAAWGGGLLLSRKYRHLLNGIQRANSVTWNPHKLMCTPLQCSAILTREKGMLNASNTLFDHEDLDEAVSIAGGTRENNTLNKSLQTGRHNDVFKIWLMWRAKGHSEFERQIDQLMDLARYMQEEIEQRPGFRFVIDKPEFLNICFWYVPKSMRHLTAGKDRDEILGQVAPKIKAHLMNRGGTMIGYQPLGDRPNFFRMIISNPASTRLDIDYLLDEIETFGEL